MWRQSTTESHYRGFRLLTGSKGDVSETERLSRSQTVLDFNASKFKPSAKQTSTYIQPYPVETFEEPPQQSPVNIDVKSAQSDTYP